MIGLAIFVIGVSLLRLIGGGASDGRRTWSGRSGRWLIAWILLGPVWLACLIGMSRGLFTPFTIGFGVATTLSLFPWPIVRALLIPLGLVRSAFWLTRLADITWGHDPHGGAALAAVLAASHGRSPPSTTTKTMATVRQWWRRLVVRPSDLAFARDRVQRLDLLGAAGATAAVLLADLDDDEDRGDALAAAIGWFDPEVVPGAAARILAERTLVRLGRQGHERRAAILALPARGSPTVRLVQALLRRDDDDGVMTRLACVGWWLLAPHRTRTWPLLRGRRRVLARQAAPPATTTPAPPATTTATTPAAASGPSLAAAAGQHLALCARSDVGLGDVVELARSWEAALPAALVHLRARAVALKVDGDQVTGELQVSVLGSLRQHIEALDLSTVDLATLPVLLQQAVAAVRSERLDALEIAVAAWRQRLEAGMERAPVDELREWAALRTLAEAVRRTGDDGRYLSFEASQWVTCELAVHLWNVRREHRLANAIFRSLLEEARALGDTRAEETQKANVACGP